MSDIARQIDEKIQRAGRLAQEMAQRSGSLRHGTMARYLDRLVEALPQGPSEALPIADALCAMWAPKAEPEEGSDEERLSKMLDDVRAAIVAWQREQPPPPGVTYFPIDPSRSIPCGPDISYECLKCGDVIASVEEAGKPWNCGCYGISVDHPAGKTWIEDPANARGVRVATGPV